MDNFETIQTTNKEKRHMSIDKVVNVVEIAIHNVPYMESLYRQAKDEAEKMQRTIQRLASDIAALQCKISLLDMIAFSSEQECKRTEQQVQELGDKKDRIERLITNMLNGEDYSKAKQITKENIKAILSDNKILISIAFVALIQTIKTDPQMVKLIQNMPSVNDGEQYKDNNDNIKKYLEVNKDSILKLSEKNYENLVEAFTKNAINTVFHSSNSILSLPQSSSTLLSSANQSDTDLKEEPEFYHNSEDDIAD